VVVVSENKFPVPDRGRWPQYISNGENDGEFILSSAKDFQSGVVAISVSRDEQGNLKGTATGLNVKLTPALSDSAWLQKRFQQNIQRAAGNVIVEYNGKEYALVADYNFLFNDVHFTSDDGFGFGKQIGGKIGVIEDPFGKSGPPRYLGATTPIVGGAVDHLSLSADGKLYADVFIEEVTSETDRMYKSVFVWDAAEIVHAAVEADARHQLLSTPIDRAPNFSGQVAVPARYDGKSAGEYFGWTYGIGTYRDTGERVILSGDHLPDPIITLTALQVPDVKLETFAERLNPDDALIARYILGGLDLLVTGGYFQRYDERVRLYNQGKGGTYDDFVRANVTDAFATAFATIVTFGVGNKISVVASGASTLYGKILGNVAGGFAAGVTFETLLQAGLVEIARITNGAYGEAEFSVSKVFTAGGFGAVLGGAFATLGARAQLYEFAPQMVQDLLQKMGRLVGLDAARSKLVRSEAPTSEISLVPELVEAQAPRSEIRPGSQVLPSIQGQTEIRVNGRLVAVTPRAESMTIAQASEWYRAQVNQLATMLDKRLPVEIQARQAEQLKKELMNGATAALLDQELAFILREAFAGDSLERIAAQLSSTASGTKLDELVLAKVVAPIDKPRFAFESGACFVAGTLVHTKQGLVPIEQLKVGDLVLSSPESGEGAQEYKRVVKTMQRHDQPIMKVVYKADREPDRYKAKYASLTTTYDHPFWAEGEGWTAARNLQGDYLGPSKLRLVDGAIVDLQGPTYIYATDRASVGWVASNGPEEPGWLVDYGTGQNLPGPVGYDWENWNLTGDDDVLQPVFRTTVFNIEVEDFHTYYVGEHGVWVHNANCDGITLFAGGVPGPLLPKGTKLFASEKELIAFTKANPGLTGFAVVKMPGAQNYAGVPSTELTNWLQFEDLVAGRLLKEEVRQEFAVLYSNANEAGRNYVRVEGQQISPSGTRVFVDRKLQFPNLNDLGRQQDVLNLLWRVTQALEQNPSYRWAFEFKARLNGDERVALQKARDLFESIKRNDASTPKFFLKDVEGNYTIPDPDSASKIARVRAMLGVGADGRPIPAKIEIRNEGTATAFPQNVVDEGTAGLPPLTLSDVGALLARARTLWIDAGASPAVVYSATVRIADLPLGFAGQTVGSEITLDIAGAGWGWYVDAGDGDSTAFEPTSSDSNFRARPGSDAESKLDLLTVLIHEIGHVLGLPSNTDGTGVMSQFLAPGERRVPAHTDVSALGAEGMPYFTGGTGVTLVIGTSSLPRSGISDVGDFDTLGDRLWPNAVEVVEDGDSVTLLESLARQSHFSKEFAVSPSDRALSFTVTRESLVANGSGPNDAFEVALQLGALYSGSGDDCTESPQRSWLSSVREESPQSNCCPCGL